MRRKRGNTWGRVVQPAPPAPVSAEGANPEVDAPNVMEEAQAELQQAVDDWVENSGYSQGAMISGALATAVIQVFWPTEFYDMIPAAKAPKAVKKAGQALGIVRNQGVQQAGGAARHARRRARQQPGDPPDPQRPRDGAKIQPRRMKEYTPGCFKPGQRLKRNWRGDRKDLEKEFLRQLRNQEEGLNSMTVGEYLTNRNSYRSIGRGSGAAQQQAHDDFRNNLVLSIKTSLSERGIVGSQAQQMAMARADEIMGTLAALHNPDMYAGGADVIAGFGDRKINSSLGSQWKGKVGGIDEKAEQAIEEMGPDAKMNVKLKRCKS